VNNEVLLDKLSEFLMVEQCGWQLYRVVGERATDPELQARDQEFGHETDRHRTILTGLIRDLGGDPNYVSPTARLAQAKSEALLASALVSGPLSEAEREANDLGNVLLAETKDHADWELLGQLAEQLPNGRLARRSRRPWPRSVPRRTSIWAGRRPSWPSSTSRRSWTSPARPRTARPGGQRTDLAIKEIHAAPIDKRSLSDGAKLPSVQETPTSRTSPGA
jgi:hypothetical protein